MFENIDYQIFYYYFFDYLYFDVDDEYEELYIFDKSYINQDVFWFKLDDEGDDIGDDNDDDEDDDSNDDFDVNVSNFQILSLRNSN